jgi:Ca2+-binding EF-hand superfamily protein
MNKVLVMSAVVLALSAAPALACKGDGPKGPDHGKRMGYMFDKHDTNSDGIVSQEEFVEASKARFTAMDADGDGAVSKEEAQAHHKKKREEMKEKREKRQGKQGKGSAQDE